MKHFSGEPGSWTRRSFLGAMSGAAAGVVAGGASSVAAPVLGGDAAQRAAARGSADVTVRIAPVLVDLTAERTISTIGYNGSAPGPLIRLREGVPVTVDLFNETDTPEYAHWHGQVIPAEVDGAPEEKSLAVPPHGHLRYRLTPRPAGMRFLHTHVSAGPDLHRGTYTGQFCAVYIEPRENPGAYDQEIFLATHEWEPFFGSEEEEGEEGLPLTAEEQANRAAGMRAEGHTPNGWEVGYRLFSINGKALGYGDPIRVREGQRVLLHIVNASATENIKLALPGHRFRVVGLDGNPVPHPDEVDVLQLGTAERIDAVVTMNHPGVWILGTPEDDDRNRGMGIVIEYAGRSGKAQWAPPPKATWDYVRFGETRPVPRPDHVLPMVFGKINGGKGGFNHWTINGKMYKDQGGPVRLEKGRRYRLAFRNQTDDAHPVHLHRNIFEVTRIDGRPTAGVRKDVLLVRGFGTAEVDFTADQPGLTLFHCHQILHMDFGFMQLFDVV